MSGVKERRITVNESEFNRIKQQALAAEIAKKKAEAERKAKEQIEKDLKIAKTYNKDLENRIKNINDNLTAVKKDASDTKKALIASVQKTNESIKKQEAVFDKKLADMGADFADAMDKNNRRIEQVINKKTQEIESEIGDLRNETKEEFKKVKQNISDLAKKVGDPKALINAGQDYLDIALELIEKLKDSRHELFCPGEMDKVIAATEKAKKHIKEATDNPANAANAFGKGEEAFDAAQKLYQDVAEAEILWKSKLSLALEALSAAQAEVEGREKLLMDGEQGGKVELDTDYWSEGALTSLKKQISDLRDILLDKEKAKKLGFEDLDGIAALSKDIIDDSEEIRDGAFFAILSSQERINLAEDLVCDLEAKAGLSIIKAEGYEGEDMRAANILHLKNGTTGFEVVITLKPTFRDGRCGYLAETDILSEGLSRKDAEVFEDVLKEVMGKYGLVGNDPIPVNTKKADEIKDWEKRKEVKTVSTVTAKPEIKNGVDKVKNTVNK